MKKPSQKFVDRQVQLDDLLERREITDAQYDVLDAVCRVEEGLLDYDLILEETLR